MITALEGGEWSASRSGRTLSPGKTRYPLHRRLVGPQGWSGRAENLATPGFDPWTVKPVAQSLYRLSYPAYDKHLTITKLWVWASLMNMGLLRNDGIGYINRIPFMCSCLPLQRQSDASLELAIFVVKKHIYYTLFRQKRNFTEEFRNFIFSYSVSHIPAIFPYSCPRITSNSPVPLFCLWILYEFLIFPYVLHVKPSCFSFTF